MPRAVGRREDGGEDECEREGSHSRAPFDGAGGNPDALDPRVEGVGEAVEQVGVEGAEGLPLDGRQGVDLAGDRRERLTRRGTEALPDLLVGGELSEDPFHGLLGHRAFLPDLDNARCLPDPCPGDEADTKTFIFMKIDDGSAEMGRLGWTARVCSHGSRLLRMDQIVVSIPSRRSLP